MRVVDDEAVGDEVVIALNGQIVRLLDATRFDRDDAVPEHVRLGEVGQVKGAEALGEAGDG